MYLINNIKGSMRLIWGDEKKKIPWWEYYNWREIYNSKFKIVEMVFIKGKGLKISKEKWLELKDDFIFEGLSLN